jgi:hypothetical protein
MTHLSILSQRFKTRVDVRAAVEELLSILSQRFERGMSDSVEFRGAFNSLAEIPYSY